MPRRSIRAGNERSYARFVFFSHVSRMGASDAIGRFFD